MLKSKGAMIGVAVALVASALTFASLGVTATAGAGTDDAATPTAVPSTPPQAPIEPVAPTNAGDEAGAGAAPGELPDAGYGMTGTQNSASEAFTLLALGGAVLLAGAAIMFAGTKVGAGRQL